MVRVIRLRERRHLFLGRSCPLYHIYALSRTSLGHAASFYGAPGAEADESESALSKPHIYYIDLHTYKTRCLQPYYIIMCERWIVYYIAPSRVHGKVFDSNNILFPPHLHHGRDVDDGDEIPMKCLKA
jgi:hypothetical protein